MVVRCLRKSLIASCSLFSVAASSAEVASSKMTTFGALNIILAMASRCRSPPDSRTPPRPTTVSSPCGIFATASSSWAIANARHNSPSDRGRPIVRLLRAVSFNNAGCCNTTPTFSRTNPKPMRLISAPPNCIRPLLNGYKPNTACAKVDLPPPLAPTTAIFSPGRRTKDTPRRISSPSP